MRHWIPRAIFFLFLFFFSLFASFFLPASPAAALDAVTWMEVEFPPGYIHQGPLAGQGYEDVITRILMENLTEYRHDKMMGNLARMYHEFKKGRRVCNVALFKTPERQTFLHFSIPSTFTLPVGLITLKERLHRFGNATEIRLAAVLQTDLRLGISRGRSYGKAVDAVLREAEASAPVFVHSGKDVFESLMRMLLSDRLDYLLGLPEEVIYVAEKMGVRDRVATIALKENQGTYDAWLGHVACSKTPWGAKIIQRIDAILREERPTDRYRSAYERWLDENQIPRYRELYDRIFIKTDD
jgi:uncharacterized protein (TIGR02285 family)